MLRRIVVPLDGSDFARSALPYAVALASSDTTLELVSAFDPSAYLTVTGYGGITGAPGYDAGTEVPAAAAEYTVELRRRREEELDRVAEEVRSAFDADVRWTMLDGPPAETIAEHASGEVDLMVLSTHGRGGLERAWLGSVADRLVQRSPAPLLLVRPREDHAHARALESPPRIRRVLVPLDGSRLAEAVLEPAATLADAAGAAVVLASVIPTDLMVGSPYLPHLAREREGRRGEKTREIGDYLDEVAERLRG
ncbi:MAG: universal stress protein, partial [Gemmatimonadota bacterium]